MNLELSSAERAELVRKLNMPEPPVVPPKPPTPPVEFVFKQGDKVALKSGGPNMTVQNLRCPGSHLGWLETVWFEGTKLQTQRFQQDSLEAAK